jgi:hypothetical protein
MKSVHTKKTYNTPLVTDLGLASEMTRGSKDNPARDQGKGADGSRS